MFYHITGSVNLTLLRKQQIKLGLLKAARVLFGRQDNLRQILCQPALAEHVLPDQSAPAATGSEDDLSPDTDHPVSLYQQLMVAATQPSPLKAIFVREELEVRLPSAYST